MTLHQKTKDLLARLKAKGNGKLVTVEETKTEIVQVFCPEGTCRGCAGTGKSSKGWDCYPCCGTGKEGERNRREQSI